MVDGGSLLLSNVYINKFIGVGIMCWSKILKSDSDVRKLLDRNLLDLDLYEPFHRVLIIAPI